MLVAGTALSLIAPVASQADTVNLEEMNSYVRSEKSNSRLDNKTFVNEVNEEIASLKGRLDGLEAKQNNFEAGGFSDTTTLDGKAVFALAAADHNGSYTTNNSEALQMQYVYQMNLNTSFTGDDNLYVRLKTGNAAGWTVTEEQGGYLSSSNGNGDAIKVDKIWYTFPVGERNTFWIGPEIENYYMHATTPSIYSPTMKQFTLGGNASAYGASTNSGLGWAYKADNGFAASSNVVSKQTNSSTKGFLTDQAETSWATQVGYTQPQYSVSAIVNMKYNGWEDYYFSTTNGRNRDTGLNSTNIGLRAWWRPQETGTATPSISVGYDTSDTDVTGSGGTNTTAYFVGLTWQDTINADDRIGIAIGQPQKHEDDTVDPFLYEVYYDFPLNDSVTITPAFFGGTSKNSSGTEVDMTGYVVNTTFKF